MDGLALTKLDVLSGLPDIKVAIAYKLDGVELDEPPMDPDDMGRAEPVFTTMPGWGPIPKDARELSDLPAAARHYVEAVERWAGVPFTLVSVGPDRAETITISDPFA